MRSVGTCPFVVNFVGSIRIDNGLDNLTVEETISKEFASRGTSKDNPDLLWKYPKLNEGSPLRISAVHLCSSDQIWSEHDALTKTALNMSLRVRTRVHHGV